MTLTSTIINDAFRQSNLIALGTILPDVQTQEALRYLNRLVKSVFGNEVGEQLWNIPIGRNNISRPAGYPWYNNVPDNNWFVPKNARLMLNVTSSVDIYLDPAPDDGTRFAAMDMSNDLASNPVTIIGNGRLIDGTISEVLNVNGFNAEWLYRDDIGTWMKYAPLIIDPIVPTDDTFPFPEEFDDFFISMLAMRLNPEFGAAMDPQSQAILTRAAKQLKARYTQVIQTPTETALWRLPNVAADRQQWGYGWGNYDSTSEFNSGRPYWGI